MIWHKTNVIGHVCKIYCKANKNCEVYWMKTGEYTKRLGYKITEKEKALSIMYWISKMHKNPTGVLFIIHLKYAPRKKFLNLFPMSLSSYTPKLKIFIKMLVSYQIITSFGSYKILTL